MKLERDNRIVRYHIEKNRAGGYAVVEHNPQLVRSPFHSASEARRREEEICAFWGDTAQEIGEVIDEKD